MEKIRIITESASDMGTPEREDVTVLPMHITFGEKEYLDGVDLSHREFYNMLIESDELPKTSLISPAPSPMSLKRRRRPGSRWWLLSFPRSFRALTRAPWWRLQTTTM